MTIDAALVREQGVTFAVVAVKNHAVSSDSSRREAMVAFGTQFPGVPIVLMAQDSRGRPSSGPSDIVRFLAKVPVNALPEAAVTGEAIRRRLPARKVGQPAW